MAFLCVSNEHRIVAGCLSYQIPVFSSPNPLTIHTMYKTDGINPLFYRDPLTWAYWYSIFHFSSCKCRFATHLRKLVRTHFRMLTLYR